MTPISSIVFRPRSYMSLSASCLFFSTISSIRAGCIRLSAMRSSRDFLAMYLRKRSKLDKNTVSGASSIMSDTPVAFSNAMILRPSFQMIFPLRSSLSSCIIVCVVSPVTSPAYCCMLFMRISRAISSSRTLRSFFFFSIRVSISRS